CDHRVLPSFPTRRSSDLVSLITEPPGVPWPLSVTANDATLANATGPLSGSTADGDAPAGAATRTVTAVTTVAATSFDTTRLTLRSEEHTSELQSRENLVC